MAAALKFHLEAFTRLSDQERASLEQLARRHLRELAARRDLAREGERPRGALLIVEGWACRYKQFPDGRRQIVHFIVPGDLCDTNAGVAQAMDHSIGSISRLVYSELPVGAIETLGAHHPRLLQAFRWSEMTEAAIAREWTANVGQRTAYERLAHLFCELFLRLDRVGLTDGASCEWPLTQSDLADATGLTAVHVNRTLQELRRDGLIELGGKRLTLPDLRGLMQVGVFSANYLHAAPSGRSPCGTEDGRAAD